MPSILDQMMQHQRPGKGKVVVGSFKQEEKNLKSITITVSMFFDGTKNNRTNTLERINKTKIFQENDEDDCSYDNYYSNVAILEYMNT